MIGLLILLSAISCSETSKQTKSKITVMTNKEKAHAINVAVQTTDTAAIHELVREDYIQHTPIVPDGRKGLLGLLSKIANKEIPAPQIKNVRTFEDGDIVVLHHDVNWPNRKAMIEIFRFKDGLAAEHWSGIMDHPEQTANGHSLVDGATEVTDKPGTQKNKALVRSFVETVLIKGQFDKVLDFYHTDIIQHNPFIPDSVEGLIKGIQDLGNKGITLQLEKIHHVFGEGNFVLTVSEGKLAGKPTAFFDLFRTENGKVVEHWDVLQEIPDNQAHANSMF
jgi:predicted SnoaL-like aldol condensation-catalyzing enzyme